MNIAFVCVLIASLMPFALTAAAKAGGHSRETPFTNRDPRGFLARLTGWPARANAAQQNSWEALALFAPAVLMASYANVTQNVIDFWALWFIGWRLAYVYFYIANRSKYRSLVWLLAALAPMRLMIAAI